MNLNDNIAAETLPDAVAALRTAQTHPDTCEGLKAHFPAYGSLVMQADSDRYLELASAAGMEATHLLIVAFGDVWLASVDTFSTDLSTPLASVALADHPDRATAVREACRAATDNGWMLAPERDWSDYDCGGDGEIHIPIRPAAPAIA